MEKYGEIEVHDRDNQGIWNYYYVINNLICLQLYNTQAYSKDVKANTITTA